MALGIDAQSAEEKVLAHVPAVEHEHEVAPVVETAAKEFGEALRRGREKAARDRRVARGEGPLLDGGPNRFETCAIAAGREPGEHAGEDPLGQ